MEARDVQTQVKHRILEKYLKSWGGIILSGLKSTKMRYGGPIRHNFVYVDCFAYCGRYSGNVEDFFLERAEGPVPGSPLIAIRVLDQLVNMAQEYGIDLRVNTILIEQISETFDDLIETLSEEDLLERVKITSKFKNLESGDIAVINGDSTQFADELLSFTGRKYTKSFYFLDPYGPTGIPSDFVQQIIQKENHDVMINFPFYDLQKKTGSIQTPEHQKHVEHWTRAFGSEEWIRIVEDIERNRDDRDAMLNGLGFTLEEAKGDPVFREFERAKFFTDAQIRELKERSLVDLYRIALVEMDPSLAVKSIRLRFPDKERPMFYLFLTTHDPTGALRMNKILDQAKLWEYELRYIRRAAKAQIPPEGQLPLFKLEPEIPECKAVKRPTISECANKLADKFAGKTVTRKDIYREFADEIYFPSEVDKAIKHLKKEGKLQYEGKLSHNKMIEFADN